MKNQAIIALVILDLLLIVGYITVRVTTDIKTREIVQFIMKILLPIGMLFLAVAWIYEV